MEPETLREGFNSFQGLYVQPVQPTANQSPGQLLSEYLAAWKLPKLLSCFQAAKHFCHSTASGFAVRALGSRHRLISPFIETVVKPCLRHLKLSLDISQCALEGLGQFGL